jgi:hypothetical protein
LNFFKNGLPPTLIASLTYEYWQAYIHSRIYVHCQYVCNTTISEILF